MRSRSRLRESRARRPFAGLLLAGLPLAACAGVVHERPAADFAPFVAFATDPFPGADAVLQGTPAVDADPALRVGDAALFGVEVRRGDHIERQLLMLEVVRLDHEVEIDGRRMRGRNTHDIEITSTSSDGEVRRRKHRVREAGFVLHRFTESGTPLRSSRVMLFEESLRAGWWPYTCRDAGVTEDDMAMVLTTTLQNLANDDDTLRELLFLVVDAPSVFSVIANLGVRVTISWKPPDERQLDFPGLPTAQPVRSAAMELSVNGAQALWVDVIVTQPAGALLCCGGLVGAVARHPADPERSAAVRLLAARRVAVR